MEEITTQINKQSSDIDGIEAPIMHTKMTVKTVTTDGTQQHDHKFDGH